MIKYSFIPIFLLSGLFLNAGQPPQYSKSCAYIRENLDDNTITQLKAFLGDTRVEDLANDMPQAAKDSINYYAKQLDTLRLGGPYSYAQLDNAIKPYHIDLLAGINKFYNVLYNIDNTHEERIFALKVLIGLYTIEQLPLNVTHILKRNEFIKHDIFVGGETMDYGHISLTALKLSWGYRLGVRVAQAKGNPVIINAAREEGYEAAGMYIGHTLNGMLAYLHDREFYTKHPGYILEHVESPHSGEIIEPGKDPIYIQSFQPSFPGGYPALYQFLDDHLYYPKEEWDKGIEGHSMVSIVIEKDGSVSHIKVESPVSPGIDSAMVNAIRQLPNWQPAQFYDNGPPARSRNVIIWLFQIKPDQKREYAFNTPFADNIKPTFPGGKTAFEKYINDNINYTGPPYGPVTFHYRVKTSGKLEDIKLLRSLSPTADSDAFSLMEQSPPWKPGLLHNKVVIEMGDTVSIWFRPRKMN